MKHTVTYQIEGGLKHTWTTKNRIETATLNNELIFSAKQKRTTKMYFRNDASIG